MEDQWLPNSEGDGKGFTLQENKIGHPQMYLFGMNIKLW